MPELLTHYFNETAVSLQATYDVAAGLGLAPAPEYLDEFDHDSNESTVDVTISPPAGYEDDFVVTPTATWTKNSTTDDWEASFAVPSELGAELDDFGGQPFDAPRSIRFSEPSAPPRCDVPAMCKTSRP